MKTASEVTQEIMRFIAAKPTWGNADLFKFEHLVTQALTAYANERVKEEILNADLIWQASLKAARIESRAEVFEEAAKIAENTFHEEKYDLSQLIANQIRALKEMK